MSPRPAVRVKRVYDPRDPTDGVRILVDRLWPRGVRKQDLDHDAWMKDVAPSGELRTWYGHRPERFERFARRFRDELGTGAAADALGLLRETARSRAVTLLTATRDVERSAAAVLAEVLKEGGRRRGRKARDVRR
jgi:uncharacterized protein YeaO (DUF488 family)